MTGLEDLGSLPAAPSVPTEQADGGVLDASQRKAIEHAAMDAGAYSWRRARLAMVEDGQIIGYPAFSRADMAELARLYREDATPPATPIAGGDRWADLERLARAAYRDYGVADIAVGGGMRATISVPAFNQAANPAAIMELIAAARQTEGAGQ
jgi:hypothetical protein